MSQIKVSAKRHLAKTVSYRIISTLIGFLIIWLITGKVEIGAMFGIAELVYKPIQYYLHERIWYRWITYGLIRSKPSIVEPFVDPIEEPIIIDEVETPIKRLTYSKNLDN